MNEEGCVIAVVLIFAVIGFFAALVWLINHVRIVL